MSTLGQAVCALEEQLFVGRESELARFRDWLSGPSAQPEILNVSGPGGVGKSALLGAFRRAAGDLGRPIVSADASSFRATPRGLLDALGGGPLPAVVDRLNRTAPVLVLDSFDEIAGVSEYLRERFLPRLDADVRVVIAGRKPLASLWPREDVWQKLVRPMVVQALPQNDARTYLERRGLADRPQLMDQILVATRGHPLGLSLACDMALRLRAESLLAAPEWPLVMRSLVERLHETEDPDVRDLLECGALVRQFDEATLQAVAGCAPNPTAFARICSLSVVQPTTHGLALHDDVRSILAQDLRWRDPERYQTLTRRAVAYYQERARRARPADRAWLVCDRLFLSEHAPLQTLLFGHDWQGPIRVDSGRPDDRRAIRAAWDGWLVEVAGAHPGEGAADATASDRLIDRTFLDGLLHYPGTHLCVARDRNDRFVGFAASVPVSKAALPLLSQHPALAKVVQTYLGASRDDLPAVPEVSNIVCHTHLVSDAASTEHKPATAALLRRSLEVMAHGGVHLAHSPIREHQVALELLGFEPISGATSHWWSLNSPTQGYVLDLTRTGVEPWTEALAAGRRPPKRLDAAGLEQELHLVLPHWHDDVRVGQSALWGAARCAETPPEDRSPAVLRETVRAVLTRLNADARAEERFACRALELAYLTPRINHEAAAQRMAISRATLYRLLKRGMHLLAEALSQPDEECLAPSGSLRSK